MLRLRWRGTHAIVKFLHAVPAARDVGGDDANVWPFHMHWAEFALKRTVTDACHEEQVKALKVSTQMQILQILHILNYVSTR